MKWRLSPTPVDIAIARLEAFVQLTQARLEWPLFRDLEPEIRRLMERHTWLSLAHAYELAAFAYMERTEVRDDGRA